MHIVMGRVGSPHGVTGDLVLHYYTSSIEGLLNYSNWYIKLHNQAQWSMLTHEEVYRVGSKIIIKLPGIDSREQSVKYVNAEIGVLKADFPELINEFYWLDLIGCDVINHQNKSIGKVSSLMETGANDVLVIKTDDNEILIPFVSDYVLEVCIDKQNIKVYWDENFS